MYSKSQTKLAWAEHELTCEKWWCLSRWCLCWCCCWFDSLISISNSESPVFIYNFVFVRATRCFSNFFNMERRLGHTSDRLTLNIRCTAKILIFNWFSIQKEKKIHTKKIKWNDNSDKIKTKYEYKKKK